MSEIILKNRIDDTNIRLKSETNPKKSIDLSNKSLLFRTICFMTSFFLRKFTDSPEFTEEALLLLLLAGRL